MENSQSYIAKIRQFAKERVEWNNKVDGVLEINKRQKEIAKALAESAYFLGIRDLSESMIDMLVRYTMTHYTRFNGDKIRLAFELAIAGKTECQTDHFGNFSGIYISKVFVAYEKLEQQFMNDYKKEIEREKLAEIAAKINLIDVAKNWAPTVYEYAVKIENLESDYDLIWPPETIAYIAGKTMYDYFVKVGILPTDKENTANWRVRLGDFCCGMRECFETAPKIADQLGIMYKSTALKNPARVHGAE